MYVSTKSFVSFSYEEGESKLPLKMGWERELGGGGGANKTCRMATMA